MALAVAEAHAADTYDIGVIMPLTGGGAFLGKAERQSLELAQRVVNAAGGVQGKPLRLVFQDDQSSPQVAVQLTNQALAEHPPVLLGSSLVAMCNAMAPLMQKGPVEYCFSPGIHPPAGSYVFTSSVSTLDLANAIVRYFRLKGWTRIALMTSTDASGQDAERGLNSVLALPENQGMNVVERAHFNTSDVSVAAQLERVKQANPQAFIAWSTGSPIATIFRGIIQAGLDCPVATTDGNMTQSQMAQYAGFLPKQLYFPTAQWVVAADPAFGLAPEVMAKQKAFYLAFKEAGIAPDLPSQIVWEATMILTDTLNALGPNATAEAVRAHIAGLSGYAGINGIYDFAKEPQRGLTVQNAVVTRWDPDAKRWTVVSKATGVPAESL